MVLNYNEKGKNIIAKRKFHLHISENITLDPMNKLEIVQRFLSWF